MRLWFGDCTFDSAARTLQRAGEDVRISGKAFQLLELLLAARPNPIAKQELFAKLWPDTFVSDANLASLIKEIRQALGDDAKAPRYIRTVHRFGYGFNGAATDMNSADVNSADVNSAPRPATVRDFKRYTHDAATYQLYLKGRHHWNRRTVEGITRAIGFFEAAIARDATYAPAFAGLADSYIALASRDLEPPLQLFPKAETAARRALELDAELAEAHASMAAIHEVFHWDWPRAEGEYLAALRLNPGYVTARQWYALGLAHHARFVDALAQMTTASESDPLSFILNANHAVVHYLARGYDAAEELCHRALEINPHHEPSHFTLGLARQQRGRVADAKASLEKALAISHGEPHVMAALSALERDRARLDQLSALARTRHVSDVHFATIHVALDEKESALACLERAEGARSGWLVYLATEPRFDALRGERRFTELLARIHRA
ncbi:MAG TPA: winged helix-turn-helix domain-containing protein [Thermoanaerobaculia bacterium]|nr:winged helix-turn-helix domain-containing protein [Thermoanaerobaculia bacterium]